MIEILEHVPLKEHGTFRIGGPARFFAVAGSLGQVREALEFRQRARLPLFILGGGSNMLFSDEGFDGLVLKIELGGTALEGGDAVSAGAGVVWDDFVAWTVNKGFSGLENMSGIPGTVGGAVVGNIGAYGCEVKDVLAWVEAFDGSAVRRFLPEECGFAYRASIFKASHRHCIILRAAFKLRRQAKPDVTYPDLLRYFSGKDALPSKLTPYVIRKAVLDIRGAKLPDVRLVGTAGSFFKNPVIAAESFAELKKRFPDMPGFAAGAAGMVKVPAGWLLDKICGFKGKRWGDIGTHEHQALVLVNFGDASATGVIAAAQEMAAAVKAATGITLEREVEYL